MGAKRQEGVAIILESSRELERDGDAWPVPDLGLNRYGRRRYEFALDVRRLLGEQYARKHEL